MAFVFVKCSRTKTNETLYLMESYRDANGKSTTRIVERLGTVAELSKQHADPKEWAKEYARQRSRAAKHDGTKVQINLDSGAEIERDRQVLYNCGYLILQSLFYQLRLDQLCDNLRAKHKVQYNLNSILSRMLYGRILFPDSKLRTYQNAATLLEPPDFELHQVYRALDLLAKEGDRIQKFVYRGSKEICRRRDQILYYDCSNYFTEAEEPSGLRQYGASKEHRPSPIVEMGLFMDASGIPLAFSVWPGNTNEQITLKPLEEKIVHDFRHAKFIVCTDAGLSSKANRTLNNAADRAFITTQSVKKLRKYLRDWALDPEGWRLEGVGAADGDDDKTYSLTTITKEENLQRFYDKVFYKERWFKQDDLEQRLIVTFSVKYMLYQRRIRAGQIERAEKLINECSGSLRKKNAHDCRRFVRELPFTDEGEVAQNVTYAIADDVIEQEAAYDGFYAVCTNLEDGIGEIVRINKGRWEIEECFRISKSLLDARPIYVWLDEHIEAHFLICFLALLLFRLLEQLLAEKCPEVDCTADKLVDALRGLQLTEHESDQGLCWTPAFVRTDLTDALQTIFGLVLNRQVLTKEMMRHNYKVTKSSCPR